MGTREEEVTHRVAPAGVTGTGMSTTPEEALLAVGHSQTNDQRKKNKRVEGLIP